MQMRLLRYREAEVGAGGKEVVESSGPDSLPLAFGVPEHVIESPPLPNISKTTSPILAKSATVTSDMFSRL